MTCMVICLMQDMYNYIKNNLDFDQMIWEFGTEA